MPQSGAWSRPYLTNVFTFSSTSIREAAGFTVKSALSHTFLHDTRDSVAVPARGLYLKLSQVCLVAFVLAPLLIPTTGTGGFRWKCYFLQI